MARHDENKDLRLISRKCQVDYSTKIISANPGTVIGIRTWGRIDFLSHCGWRFYWIRGSKVKNIISNDTDNKESYRAQKKAAKEHKLTDKTKTKKK